MIAVALAIAAVVMTLVDASLFEWHRGGAPWRILTCHLTHWTHAQLAWDALAFAALGFVTERCDRRAFLAAIVVAMIAVPFAVSLFSPEVVAYRGLSGLASAVFALLLIQARREPLTAVFALAFVAKLAYEATTGGALFASELGAGVVPLPVAHLAGAVAGAVCGAVRALGAGRPQRPLRNSSATARISRLIA